ncbi:MAG: hypothetical protein WC415_00195 [Patescibacteria group bacterium]|jgi:hypothetical protein
MKHFLYQLKNKVKSGRFKLSAILAGLGISKYGKKVLAAQSGNNLISTMLNSNQPYLVARIGSVELDCLHFYLTKRQKSKINYPDFIKKTMENNAGFFPINDESLDKFCKIFIANLKSTDLVGVWYNKNEDYICHKLCPKAKLADLKCIEPYYHQNPWSSKLEGKKILVIHPCSKTILSQYKNNQKNIFSDHSVLPKFNLQTITAVQSAAGEKTEFTDWFSALEKMKNKIATKDFDLAIIGAGAYGLPLAAYIKSLGKQAIHLGGATQILFGIKGGRWDSLPSVSKFYNKHWVRPLPEETPGGAKKVENGCYW